MVREAAVDVEQQGAAGGGDRVVPLGRGVSDGRVKSSRGALIR